MSLQDADFRINYRIIISATVYDSARTEQIAGQSMGRQTAIRLFEYFASPWSQVLVDYSFIDCISSLLVAVLLCHRRYSHMYMKRRNL